MKLLLYMLPRLGVLLQGVLLWRLLRRGLRFKYPYFTLFVLFSFTRDLSLFPIVWYKPEWFAWAYWHTEIISLFLRFAVIWEFFRGVFPERSLLHEIAWKSLVTVEVVLLPTVLWLGSSQNFSLRGAHTYLSPLFEQYLSLAQALLLLAPVVVALYYHLPLGRNMRGLGLGFGMYLCICSIDVANVQIFPSFFAWWRLLSPATFFVTVLVWTWAFWKYAPSPAWCRKSNIVPTGQSTNFEWSRTR